MDIITNNTPRLILYSHELTEEELKEFDYMDDVSEGSFFRYKGQVYSLDSYMRLEQTDSLALLGWHGYNGDTYFSGTLIRLDDSGDMVIVGRYFC